MRSVEEPIDVTEISSYGHNILELLKSGESSLRENFNYESEVDKSEDLELKYLFRENPENSFYRDFLERNLIPAIRHRLILGWHYSRLVSFEIEKILCDGINVTTQDSMERRLSALVEKELISADQYSHLLDCSPLRNPGQRRARLGKFWMVSSRLPVSHSGVAPLLSSWGGEVVYFWQNDPSLKELLRSLGSPAIVEISAPISKINQEYRIAVCMLENYISESKKDNSFDFCVEDNLPARFIRRVLTPDQPDFSNFGKTTP